MNSFNGFTGVKQQQHCSHNNDWFKIFQYKLFKIFIYHVHFTKIPRPYFPLLFANWHTGTFALHISSWIYQTLEIRYNLSSDLLLLHCYIFIFNICYHDNGLHSKNSKIREEIRNDMTKNTLKKLTVVFNCYNYSYMHK